MSPAPDWAWYQVGKPRYLATSALRGTPEGSFVIRRSESQPACYALTYKANGQYWDELIILPSGHLTGPDVHLYSLPQHRFPNLEALIVQFSKPGSPLVCPLAIPVSFAAQSRSPSRGFPVSSHSRPTLRSVPLPKGGSAPQLQQPSSIVKTSPSRSPLTTTATVVTPNPRAIPPRTRHSAPQILPPRSTPRSRSRRARTHTAAVTPTPSNQRSRHATRPGFQPRWLDAAAQRARWCLVAAQGSEVLQVCRDMLEACFYALCRGAPICSERHVSYVCCRRKHGW